MRTELHMTSLSVIVGSWLIAIAALGSALALAAVGQGLGAMVGGCGWTGAAVPIHRQVWALVNQPVLNFSSLPIASGYWLGSLVFPLFVAVFLFGLRPRRPSLFGQLVVVQASWWAALVAGAWLPLLDPEDGHLGRWLLLQRLPADLVWLAPVIASGVALWAALRLLAVARSNQRNMNRGARIWILILHLMLPVGAWLGVVYWIGGGPPMRPVWALLIPVATVAVLAWVRYPPPLPQPLSGPSKPGFALVFCAAALTGALIWWAGWPLGEGRVTAMLWKNPSSFNNIRSWIEPRVLNLDSTEESNR